MKVLQLTAIPVTAVRFVLPLAEALAESGWEVEFGTGSGEEEDRLRDAGFPVHSFPIERAIVSTGNLRAVRRVRSLLRDGRFDAVHLHTPVAAAIGRWAARDLEGLRCLYTMHGSLWGRGAPPVSRALFTLVERAMAPLTDHAFVLNPDDQRDLARKAGISRDRITRLPAGGAGVPEAFFQVAGAGLEERRDARRRYGLDPEAPTVAYVGRMAGAKGMHLLAEAFRRLLEVVPQAQLMVLGEALSGDDDPWNLSRFVRAAGVSGERVKWLGFRAEPAPFYRMMDLLVLPSHREGFGMALAEAAAAGIPTVATASRGARAVIDEGVTGRLVPLGAVESLAGAMAELLRDPETRARMGQAGVARAREHFTRAAVLEAYLEVYRSVEPGAGPSGGRHP